MTEIAYNVGKDRVAAGIFAAGTANLAAAIVITDKTGAANPDLATLAAIDAVGTVALHATRIALTGVTRTVDNANDRVNVDTADIVFPAAPGVTALALIIYDKTTDTSDATRIPISYHDTGFPQPMDGGLTLAVADLARLI